MSKIVAAVLLLGSVPLVLGALGAGCGGTDSATPTGCTPFTPADAGTDPNLTCAIGYSCSSNSTQYEIFCTQDLNQPDNYICQCSNGETNTAKIVVNSFLCDGQGALSVANMGCNFGLSM